MVGDVEARSWIMHILQRGTRLDMGFVSVHQVTLAQAQDLAEGLHKLAATGADRVSVAQQRCEPWAGLLTPGQPVQQP